MGAFLLAATLGKWLRVRALNGEIKGFIVLAIDVRQKLNIPVIVASDKSAYAQPFYLDAGRGRKPSVGVGSGLGYAALAIGTEAIPQFCGRIPYIAKRCDI